MHASIDTPERQWLDRWMTDASRRGAMSQRKRSAVERHGGGLNEAAQAAKDRGVHLLLLTDEHGEEVLAASLSPFRVIA